MAEDKSIWTLESLAKYVDRGFESSERAVNAALAAAKEAVNKSEAAAEKRADASNEIRQAMIDAQSHFANKDKTDYQFKAVEDRLMTAVLDLEKKFDLLQDKQNNISSRIDGMNNRVQGMNRVWAILVVVFTSVMALLGLILAWIKP